MKIIQTQRKVNFWMKSRKDGKCKWKWNTSMHSLQVQSYPCRRSKTVECRQKTRKNTSRTPSTVECRWSEHQGNQFGRRIFFEKWRKFELLSDLSRPNTGVWFHGAENPDPGLRICQIVERFSAKFGNFRWTKTRAESTQFNEKY